MQDREREQRGKVNINTASRDELLAVDGIEQSGADAIIRYREAHGPFRSLDDLDPIPGFNEARIHNFRDRFTVGGDRAE